MEHVKVSDGRVIGFKKDLTLGKLIFIQICINLGNKIILTCNYIRVSRERESIYTFIRPVQRLEDSNTSTGLAAFWLATN